MTSTFVPKQGKLYEFLALQVSEAGHLGEAARSIGWRGNRIHRSLDGTSVAIVTVFESLEAKEAWTACELFAEHGERIGPLLERTESQGFELVFASGS